MSIHKSPADDLATLAPESRELVLTKIKRGYWRNRYVLHSGCGAYTYPVTGLGDGTYLARCRWPSAEIAEQKSGESNWGTYGPDRYLGPVFFPEEE